MPFVDGRTIPEILMRPGIHGRFLAHKDLGASTVSLLMNRADPGAAVPLHVHHVEETVVMFEGRIWVQLGDERRVIGPDDTVIIPAFMPHAWGTEGTEAARMMWVYGGPIPLPTPPTSRANHPSSTPDAAYDVSSPRLPLKGRQGTLNHVRPMSALYQKRTFVGARRAPSPNAPPMRYRSIRRRVADARCRLPAHRFRLRCRGFCGRARKALD